MELWETTYTVHLTLYDLEVWKRPVYVLCCHTCDVPNAEAFGTAALGSAAWGSQYNITYTFLTLFFHSLSFPITIQSIIYNMAAADRLTSLANQLLPSGKASSREAILSKHADDVVITFARRTPLTKARKGGLKDTPVDDLCIALLTAIREHLPDPSVVEDVCLGNVLFPSASYMIRAAVLASGFPPTTAASVASRWCSSGLLAAQMIANQIAAGAIDCGIAIGAESMSLNSDNGAPGLSEKALAHPLVQDTTMAMGWTSENVAGQFNVSREEMDAFAATSQGKAERAQKEGWSRDEILPIVTSFKDAKTGDKSSATVDRDDGVRPGTSAAALGKIRAAFPQWAPSNTTGGNASQVTDGAAGLLLMRRSLAEKLGQKIIGKFVAATVVALEPRIMGIGPVYAIPKLLGKVGLEMGEVDMFEVNEAFASMVSAFLECYYVITNLV